MNKKLIGTATSVSKDKNYDALDTLEFAKENDISLVQVYLNKELSTQPALIAEAAFFAEKNNIKLICHLPTALNSSVFENNTIPRVKELLTHQTQKKIVLHFDEAVHLADALDYIEKLNREGLQVYLENFYADKSDTALLKNINTFTAIFSAAKKNNLPVTPVIDLPRLFIKNIVNRFDSLFLTELVLHFLNIHSYPIALHMIDFSNYSQDRNSWVAVGKGLMPYKEIFDFCKSERVVFDLCILEYEDKQRCLHSLKPTAALLL